MNSKAHLLFSLAKSVIRIAAYYIPFWFFDIPAWAMIVLNGLAFAELLGIAEEIGDKR